MSEDSAPATLEHIEKVRHYIGHVREELHDRGILHDASKLTSPEKEIFDEFTPKLKDTKYGSDEYKSFLSQMKPALDHHYAENDHHPEFFPNGIDGMDLITILEMLADWKASTMRIKDGDLKKSLLINKERFKMSDQLCQILLNTVERMGW